jgi:hypothetical protein
MPAPAARSAPFAASSAFQTCAVTDVGIVVDVQVPPWSDTPLTLGVSHMFGPIGSFVAKIVSTHRTSSTRT